MIPRFKPRIGFSEMWAAIFPRRGAVEKFERAFAEKFRTAGALAFPYGRTALWAFFKAMGVEGKEIVIPAYTCSVVAHAVVLSGNTPRFVDIEEDGFNMDLDQLEKAINENTAAVVATHLFGRPMNIGKVEDIVKRAGEKFGRKIWLLQDCAHSFGAEFEGRPVWKSGDAAIWGLGVSKMITSIFGGMLTSDNPDVCGRVKAWRDANFKRPTLLKNLSRILYLVAIRAAFSKWMYGLVNFLESRTPLLDKFSKAYHLDDKIHFPPDHLEMMCPAEAGVGLVQLEKYDRVVSRRREIAEFYDAHLQGVPEISLPPKIEGCTYSHYVFLCENRGVLKKHMGKRGIQLGTLIDSCILGTAPYKQYGLEGCFARSVSASLKIVNLPITGEMMGKNVEKIVRRLTFFLRKPNPQNLKT